MQCHETPTAGCASADCMEPDPARTIASEDLVEQCSFAGAPGVVHQTARGIAQQAKTGQQQIQGDRDRDQRVEHQPAARSEEHTSELQSLMRISYAVFCLKNKKKTH